MWLKPGSGCCTSSTDLSRTGCPITSSIDAIRIVKSSQSPARSSSVRRPVWYVSIPYASPV